MRVYFVYVTTVFLVLVIACLLAKLTGLNSSELASWFQAIGTIMAVMSGFVITNYQIDRKNKDKIETNRKVVTVCCDCLRSQILSFSFRKKVYLQIMGKKENELNEIEQRFLYYFISRQIKYDFGKHNKEIMEQQISHCQQALLEMKSDFQTLSCFAEIKNEIDSIGRMSLNFGEFIKASENISFEDFQKQVKEKILEIDKAVSWLNIRCDQLVEYTRRS